MIAPPNSPQLYWQEGPFKVAIYLPWSIPQRTVDKTLKILEEFRNSCQEQSIIFDIANFGKHQWLNNYKHILEEGKDNKISFGTNPPDAYQLPGKSITGETSMKHLLENLKPRGEFENQLAKMLIVFIYHLWDDNFRDKIADSLSISKNQVECDLMGDIRHIRHSIIHKNSGVRQEDLNHFKMLSQIWDLKPGKLLISKNMIHSLMEQINALRVTIKSDS